MLNWKARIILHTAGLTKRQYKVSEYFPKSRPLGEIWKLN